MSVATQSISISGPLPPPFMLKEPPPFMLKEYDDVVQGGAERVVRMAEKAADHEIEFGRTALTAAVKSTSRGQHFGLVVVLAMLA